MSKNLENFFDAEGRDTFDISDLLETIGFHPKVELEITLHKRPQTDPRELFTDEFELDAINSALEILRADGGGRFELSRSSDSFLRSLRGRNRIIFKYIQRLKRAKIVSSYSLIFQHRDRPPQKFEELSSGEQTLISTYLYIRASLPNLGAIFIDEPENSLHPDWQRHYLEMLHMALGYHEAKIFLATHSPVLVSGALSSYEGEVDVVRIEGDKRRVVEVSYKQGPESVEEILWQAFDTITPVSHFLSVELSRILQELTDGRIGQREVEGKIREFERRSYDSKQKELLNGVLNNISEFIPGDNND